MGKAPDHKKVRVWKPKPSKNCDDCDFKKICKYNKLPRKMIVKIDGLK
jgi:hypothetical protein